MTGSGDVEWGSPKDYPASEFESGCHHLLHLWLHGDLLIDARQVEAIICQAYCNGAINENQWYRLLELKTFFSAIISNYHALDSMLWEEEFSVAAKEKFDICADELIEEMHDEGTLMGERILRQILNWYRYA